MDARTTQLALEKSLTQVTGHIRPDNLAYWGLRSSGRGMRLDALESDWQRHLLAPFGKTCSYFELYTEDRLALMQDIRAVLESLVGLSVTVNFRQSWRWGQGAAGQAPYFIVYVLAVMPAATSWKVESKLAKEILELPHVPRVELGNLDLDVGRHLRHNGIPNLPYCETEWTPTGLKLGLHKPAQDVLQKCFPKARITISPKNGKNTIQAVIIEFRELLEGLPVDYEPTSPKSVG